MTDEKPQNQAESSVSSDDEHNERTDEPFDRQPTGDARSIPAQRPRGGSRDGTDSKGEAEQTARSDTSAGEGVTETEVGTEDVDLEQVASSFEPADDIPSLIVISGARAGELIQLEDETTLLGRQRSKVDVCFRDPGVSRRHAAVDRESDETAVLRDLGSSNGTFINGDRVRKPTELDEGDKITLGKTTTVKFTIQDEVDEEFQRRMYESSMRDELTHTYSRAYLLEQMRTEMSFAERNDTNVALILFDLDHFKKINDSHGHIAGDRVLEQLAELVHTEVRQEDLLARYGGEEFGILVRQVPAERVVDIAERIRESVESTRFDVEGTEVRITISAGVALFEPDSMPRPTEWIRAADTAMYQAKAAGRNTVRLNKGLPDEGTDISETLQ